MAAPAENRPAANISAGTWLVVAILGIALALAAWGLFWKLSESRRPIEFWGAEHARRLQHAEKVIAYRLQPLTADTAAVEPLTIGGEKYQAVAFKQVQKAPGFTYFRRILLLDYAYLWGASTTDCRPQWQYALKFEGASGDSTLVFAFNCNQVTLLETGKVIRLSDASGGSAEYFREFFAEQWPK